MSKFAVEVRIISDVIKHPNADRLTIYKVHGLGYQFISNVKYNVGDAVVYFPIDSVMPPRLIEAFELGNMLAGKDHNRVKTVRLRKEISQGFVAGIASVVPLLNDQALRDHIGETMSASLPQDLEGLDLTEAFEIYEGGFVLEVLDRIRIIDVTRPHRHAGRTGIVIDTLSCSNFMEVAWDASDGSFHTRRDSVDLELIEKCSLEELLVHKNAKVRTLGHRLYQRRKAMGIPDNVKNMSRKDMERTIFDILTDNGMSEDEADKTIDSMSISDMEQYLAVAHEEDDEE